MSLQGADPTASGAGKVQKNQSDPATLARKLVRSRRKAALATLDKSSGHPHASLVTVATEPDGAPLLLISRLAVHTQNLLADARASLLFDGTDLNGDPLAGGRVTVIGQARPTDSPTARRRFLARHPEAAGYAEFPDFSFYRLEVERAHYIGGFGRIVTLPAAEIVVDTADAAELVAAEEGIVGHMNEDHADAVQLYATHLGQARAGVWRMTGIDPEGADLVEAGGEACRILFGSVIRSPGEARKELVRLVYVARGLGGADSGV